MQSTRLTLMAIHAHPDDEVFGTGGVFARAAAAGMRTVLVCCTGGEEGEIHDSHGDTPEARARLAATREAELRRACEILGIHELHFLGYRDSGMAGTPANDNPNNFFHADPEEVTGRLVQLIRRVQPHVVVTYDERGSYGHPDHITANRVTTAAVDSAGDAGRFPEPGLPVWQVSKFYNSVIPRKEFMELGERLRERGIPMVGDEAEDFDFTDFLAPEEVITTRVDVAPYVARKRKALFVHETQVGPDNLFRTMPEDLFFDMFRTEAFCRVRSSVPAPVRETDLFDGLQPDKNRPVDP